ncbi:PilN domain-containing protein [Paradesertivirga mongoliensis]|uniref:PilN domain-containing protein n=1 Tax=Paradesertivirga mongoliensis TaxID=2100740 RepID=A0ABW4ZJP5_9SPHI|nr:PilN domain-containing protein [Pedobacter mongoliensis]
MSSLGISQWLNSAAGLELHLLQNGSISGRLCTISIQKNSLSIDAKSEFTGSLEEILKKVPKDKQVSISLSGKGILTKKSEKEEDITEDKLLRLYPNIDPTQFYIQNFISGEFSFVSIVRKEVLDEIIRACKKEGISPLLINLGAFASSHILKQLNSYGNELKFDGHVISLSETGEWQDYKYSASSRAEFPVKIGIEPIGEQYLLAYAAAFQLVLYYKLDAVEMPVDAIQHNLSDFEQKQKFNFRLGTILAVFFVLLLINFLLFSYCDSKNNVLLAEVSQSTASVETLQQTEKSIEENEKLLKGIGWYKGISHAWLADQLGQSLPPGIRLKEISINPLNPIESNRQRKEIHKIGTIELVGETSNLDAVNELIYRLKSKSWLKRVNLDNFSPSPENDQQNFAITLNF